MSNYGTTVNSTPRNRTAKVLIATKVAVPVISHELAGEIIIVGLHDTN